ncbi:hypothetical protein BEN47_13000 [Hymenobacter lapidarius]|uniref:Entericidin EcnAB n=1 Tax=Hymenobacter lapidarius TaxID=1908237 RepID=A0A1G1T6Q4_9BACT|nr:hypothetical protein [Hymenobacter lapidarius]OGX86565.1 hypothetical protein BEN47_13000 [Hymenobacter lapidarius]
MKFSFKTLLVVAAFGAFATTSCSEQKTEAAGNAVENAADNTGAAMEGAVDSAKADMAREPGDTAVVSDRPANGVIEQIPATPQK